MRVWISRRVRLGTVSLILLYTVLISVSGFSFCTLFYCRNCQKGTITRDELVAKLSSAAHKLGLDASYSVEEKESMPKPPDSFDAYGKKGRTHACVCRLYQCFTAFSNFNQFIGGNFFFLSLSAGLLEEKIVPL